LQNSSRRCLSELLEPLFPVALTGNLQFHIERVSKKDLFGFLRSHIVLG
jgi:hypothetical protein